MKKYITILILVVCLGGCLFGLTATAYAETTVADNFDNTFVLSDLADATVFGKKFDTADYPKDATGQLRLLDFTEFCFSTKFELQHDYGLYLYIYNPQCLAFSDNLLNKVQIATEYDSKNEATKYEKFNLSICNSTADNLFYKFKVENVSKIYDRVAMSSDSRQYDVSGVELLTPRQTNAHDYKVGGTWIYKGYAKGCHASSEEESTLSSEIKSLTTIELDDLQFTYYRGWTSQISANQLTSVYFSVPKDIDDNYDELYSIQAEMYKYLTSPIFCVYDSWQGLGTAVVNYGKLYEDLLKQVGIPNPKQKDSSLDRVFYFGNYFDSFTCGYNTEYQGLTKLDKKLDTLAWLFQVSGSDDLSVSSARLLQYMRNYSASHDRTVRGKYSKDLFVDFYYDPTREYAKFDGGYTQIDISIDDMATLVGSSVKANPWKALFGGWDGTVESEPICPIVKVTYNEISNLSEEQVSQKYYIAKNDVAKFKEYVRTKTNRAVYLFRFAVSSYYTSIAQNNYGNVGYMAQEEAYLDFDIISMGYRKDGVVTVIPVVASPIDIIGGVESGIDRNSNAGLNLIALILGIVLAVAIIWLVFKLIDILSAKK